MRLEMAKQPENRVQMPIREMDEHNAKVKERSVAIPVAVDDEGDLILWTKTKGVRVSSKVLSVASPVFKAMFNYYRIAPEGSSNEPYSMSVDADGNALEELCQVLHHKPPAVSTDIEKLVQFAKVCQKYQCIMAGKPRTELCLPNFSSLRRLGSEDCVKVLYIISEFGMEGQFATTSKLSHTAKP
ncbi:hypothetical protein EV356DRAFT_87011 [Viridothelium virens]|uniref:BTB domain-containing protein n=1 Tax=Viridothelium virens TaxID=1048519 RepID=A0A6A6HF59_VIRVR|nr:hypothetical protein EV356DRAFT_87011 [Viridothelium virens]